MNMYIAFRDGSGNAGASGAIAYRCRNRESGCTRRAVADYFIVGFRRHLARAQDSYRALAERIKNHDKLNMETQQLLRVLLKDAPVAMLLLNDRREIVQMNHAAEQLFGTSIADMRGQSCERILPCYRQCGSYTALESQCSIKNEEIEVAVPGKHTLTLLRNVAVLRRPGAETMIVEAFVDVTERKASESKYHTILSTAIDGFWIVGKEGRLLEVNDAYCRMSGYSREELLNMRINELDAKEVPEETRQHIEKIMVQGSDRFESQHRRRDGVIIDVEVSVQLISPEPAIFCVFVKDITERKQNEVRLYQAKEVAEQANKAKSQFLSSMSHELRTPLNAVLGFGQLLEMDADACTSSQQESVQHILSAGHQLLGLVNDLLDLSRMDSGKLQHTLQPLGIADIASMCVEQISAAMADKSHVTIENRITDAALMVQGDDLRLRQVLINFLSNAVKYNKENGQVILSSAIEQQGRLRSEVHDTGAGIASDKLSLLFTPFERLDQKNGPIPGVGIGLHIAKRLVEAMHGAVGVESVSGEGSTFWFELPLVEGAVGSTAASATVKPSSTHTESRFVVLYIEDNPVNVKVVEWALQRRTGIVLLAAGTAEEGLIIAEQEIPNLVLMDMHLPGMDGIAATSILKRNDAFRHIPVVALSSDAMQEDIDRALNSGCDAYLTKPLDVQALYDLIDGLRTP